MDDNVRVIDRALDIIELLAQEDRPMKLHEIVEKSGMSKTTVYRLLSTLCARNYAEKREDGSYGIGYKLIETASTQINSLELLSESKPFLRRIAKEFDLNSHMGLLEKGDVVYIERLDVFPGTWLYTRVGYRSPAYCSSIGKVLMSCLSGEELDETLAQCSFKKYTKNTITDPEALKRSLHQIRRQGWAMDDEEYQEGHRCIGAPIFDYRGCAAAAMSVSGDHGALSDERVPEVIRAVKETAAEISRRMGYVE